MKLILTSEATNRPKIGLLQKIKGGEKIATLIIFSN